MKYCDVTYIRIAVSVLLVSGSATGFLFQTQEDVSDDVKWDGLRIRFGLPFSRNFRSQPRTVTDALSEGYTKISDCSDLAGPLWRGNRYVKDGDYSLILLYDVNGYIAGIQTSVPQDTRNGYPTTDLRPPFVFDSENGNYVITAYFVDPGTICTTGRTMEQFEQDGTGNNLYIQNGSIPEADSVLIPKEESDMDGTGWGRGKCFYTMGVHYWFELSRDKPCDEIFPVFILYHEGRLKAFGWAMVTNVKSPSLEHVVWPVYPFFMTPVPKCLPFQGVVSSQHIYLVDDVFALKCEGERFKSRRLH